MRVLAGLTACTSRGAVLRSALERVIPLDICGEVHLTQQLSTNKYSATIVELRGHAPGHSVTTVRTLRAEYPALPIIVYSELGFLEPTHWMALGHERISHVLLGGHNDNAEEIRRVVLSAVATDLATRVLHGLGDDTPAEVRALIRYAMANASRHVRVTDMARALNLHRRTLHARAQHAYFPSPSALIAWSRLILAADLLGNINMSADRVAELSGFGSGTALRNMLRRYTGLRPTDVRERGGADCIIAALRDVIVRKGPQQQRGASTPELRHCSGSNESARAVIAGLP